MKLKQLQKALAVGVLAVTAGYTFAAPSFTFTEYAGFQAGDVAVATYSNPIVGAATVVPAVTPLYNTMSWIVNSQPQSSLVLSTVTGPAALAANTWTTISTLVHNNVVIPGATSWANQSIFGRLKITDSEGGAQVRVDSDDEIVIALTETPNVSPCPAPNPVGSTCDDFFGFTASGLDSINFSANDGSQWLAEFQFANLVNAVFLNGIIYTAEAQSSRIDIQVRVTQQASSVPEPATLGLFGLGLLGLGIAKRRKQNA